MQRAYEIHISLYACIEARTCLQHWAQNALRQKALLGKIVLNCQYKELPQGLIKTLIMILKIFIIVDFINDQIRMPAYQV